MSDCCLYYIVQFLHPSGRWMDTQLQSKERPQALLLQTQYQASYPNLSTRLMQRKIAEDRAQGRRVPQCC